LSDHRSWPALSLLKNVQRVVGSDEHDNTAILGRAATFEDAKAQFGAALAAFREWPGKAEDSDSPLW
jgi:hypothetical protein